MRLTIFALTSAVVLSQLLPACSEDSSSCDDEADAGDDDTSDDDNGDEDAGRAGDDSSDDAGMAGGDDDNADAGRTPPKVEGDAGVAGPVEWRCDGNAGRLEPADVPRDEAAIIALAQERTGLGGAGTRQVNQKARFVSAKEGSDDNSGSETSPWKTLQHAADSVEPGTTVWVAPDGNYGPVEISNGGSDGAYVIFRSQDPDKFPQILGNEDVDAVVLIAASYVVFEGFEVRKHQRASLDDDTIGISIESDDDLEYIEVRNNLVHDIGPGVIDEATCYYNGHGIIAQSDGTLISHLIIDGNELHDLYVGNSEVLVVNGNVADFCVTNNFVHDVNNIGIDIIGYEKNDNETTQRGLITDNVLLDVSNYWPYCSRGNCTYPEGDESSDGIYVDGGAELEIAYNIVGRSDHGIELQSENGELIRDVEVHHNFVFNSNYKNFTLGDSENSGEYDNLFVNDDALANDELEQCK